MADSRLTVRTLCLATVALILACGHAHRAMAQQTRAAQDRVVPKSTSPIRVVPAGSGKSTIATVTNKGGGASRSSGSAKVATFTSKSGSGGSVATFNGDRQTVAHATSSRSKPHAQPSRKPSAPSPAKTGRKPSILPEKKDPPIIAVRRPGQHAEQPADLPDPVAGAPNNAASTPASTIVAPARPALRNAFGGLSSASTVEFTSAPRVYAHAAR
jgi:hypothetical protein